MQIDSSNAPYDSSGKAADGSQLAPKRKHCCAHLASKLALSLAAVVFALLAAEGVTRLFSHVVPPLLCNDAKVGMIYCPNFAGSVYIPESDRDVLLRFNHHGMRGPDVPYEKRPGVRRIAVVGDSMIAAVATDEDKTLVCRLADRLNASPADARFEVLNFGISASSTGQELVLYRELVRKFQPDIVICAFCVANDFGDNCQRLTSNRGRIYFDVNDDGELVQIPLVPGRAQLNSWLNRYSRFYVWQKDATQRAINIVRGRALSLATRAGHDISSVESGGIGIFCTAPGENLAHAWKITETLVQTMAQEVRADGTDFLLAVIPFGVQIYDDTWPEIVAAAARQSMEQRFPDQRLAAIAQAADFPLILMTDRFRAAAPHHSQAFDDELLHYGALGHLNDRGNDLAAEVVYQALKLRQATIAAQHMPGREKTRR
ncbi:MAG TPA: SGNH/GDSL hydrolase family protein [Pirellulales bacterium]|jgi:hypothetical protein